MSSYKKFWQNKPILRRLMAILCLVLMPILLPAIYLFLAWREILDAYIESYRDTWRVIWEKDDV